MEKVELTSDECYSVAFVVYQEWKKTLGTEEVQIFETWLDKKLEQARIKQLEPAGNIPGFMLK